MTINYKMEVKKKTLTTEEFYNRFSNFSLVQGYCKECPRYDTNYSCSPLDIDIKNFILDFEYVDIYVTQLFFKKEDYSKDYKEDELKKVLAESYFKEKDKIVKKIKNEEKNYIKAESITGPCNECNEKCKEIYDKCIHPEIRRFSLASLGIDSQKILKELFDIELLLINGKLPKYLNNITSILYSKK